MDYSNDLVPDSTVLIASTLEYSPDTSFHHTQVYVGRLSNPRVPLYNLLFDFEYKPNEELWMPIQWAQVGMKLYNLQLRPHPDNAAQVSITGPLGHPSERRVMLSFEQRGVYGDVNRELLVLPRERYRLDVHLADGRKYTAETGVPGTADWTLPGLIQVPVTLDCSTIGCSEFSESIAIPWQPAMDASLTVYAANTTLDRDRLRTGLSLEEHFPHEDRSEYLYTGNIYFVFTSAHDRQAGPYLVWAESLDHPVLDVLPLHLRLYQLSPELSRYYAPEDLWYTKLDGDPWAEQQWNMGEVVANRDTTYFRSVSNILSVGPDGRPLPKEQSDAVGIFGGYTARYAYSTMVPVRNFDPDTLGRGTRPVAPVSSSHAAGLRPTAPSR